MPMNFIFSLSGPGDIFLEDDGIPGNASGQFRHSAGGFDTVSFAYPPDSLSLSYSAGQAAYVNLFDSLGTADLSVGNLNVPAVKPDAIHVRKVEASTTTSTTVTMAATGAITEWGNDVDADIVAGIALLSAGTGIGTPAAALETDVGALNAATETGGIHLRDVGGGLQIGEVGPQMGGLWVGTSGDINLDVHGFIYLSDTDTAETIKGGAVSGNVTLNAIGGSGADIKSIVDNHAIRAPGGNIALNAGGDVSFGISNFDNDVHASGNVTINAGGDVEIGGFTNVLADYLGNGTGGDVTIAAGDNLSIVDTQGAAASVGAVGLGGGNVTLTAGTERTLHLEALGNVEVFSDSGDVTANADYMIIGSNAAITALDGKVTLRPYTAGRAIDLGSGVELAGKLRLSDAELDRIFAEELLIGGSNAGAVTVTASISPGSVPDVTIQSSSDITVNAGALVETSGDLTLRAGDDIALIAGAGIVAGGVFTGYVDIGNDDPGVGGSAWVAANFATAVRFFGGNDADTLRGGANNDWLDGSLGADTMIGRLGDDTYAVDNAGDVTTEAAGEGLDTVRATASYVLGANVEVLTQLGGGNIDGTGNGLANTLNGNGGNNTLSGLANSDTLTGNGGNDTLLGGDGGDLLNGGAGDDTLNGGNQVDTVSYAGATAAVTVALVAGAQATGGSGSDTISNVENLTGSSHADTLTGDGAVNVLTGGNGGDTLNGLGGNDTLLGEVGADTLVGGLGRDLMTGGSSGDTFDFNDIAETGITGGTRDQIIDFVQGSDKIDLATIDANTSAGGNQAFAFIGAAAFSGVAGELRTVANATITVIYGDVNGDSAADFHIQLNTPWALAAADFML
jgi:Ca2+-binding RTX toxin-like protein